MDRKQQIYSVLTLFIYHIALTHHFTSMAVCQGCVPYFNLCIKQADHYFVNWSSKCLCFAFRSQSLSYFS